VLVIVPLMRVSIVRVIVGAFVCGFKGSLDRVRLRGCFEGIGRAQRFAFQARSGEPNKLPGPDFETPDRLQKNSREYCNQPNNY
jgi:hypothetical protein